MTTPAKHPRWWLAFVALLAAAALGANWFLFHHLGSTPPRPDRHVDEPDTAVVCFGHVDVEFGIQSLFPLQPGRIEAVTVREHARVKSGDVLLRLDDRAARHTLHEAEADAEASAAQVLLAEKGIQQQAARVAQQKQAVKAAQSRLDAANSALERKRGLLKIQQMSKEEVDAAMSLVKELEAAHHAEQQKLRELELHDAKVVLRRAEAETKAKQARLELARRALDECRLKAPADGEVLRILVGPGDVLSAQPRQPAVLFCPDSPRFVRAEVAQEFASRIFTGQRALIQNDAQTAETWHGTVQRISDWYTQRRSVLYEPLQLNDVRTLECIVTIDGDASTLRLGQRVRVVIGAE